MCGKSRSDYIDVFLDPDSLTRTAGSTLYVAMEGVDTTNSYTFNSTTGDRRGIIIVGISLRELVFVTVHAVPETYEIDEEIQGQMSSTISG